MLLIFLKWETHDIRVGQHSSSDRARVISETSRLSGPKKSAVDDLTLVLVSLRLASVHLGAGQQQMVRSKLQEQDAGQRSSSLCVFCKKRDITRLLLLLLLLLV